MIELRDGPGLAIEPETELRILRERGGQYLDGDGTIQPRVLRAVHLSHATGTERNTDLIGAEPGTGWNAHAWRHCSQLRERKKGGRRDLRRPALLVNLYGWV